MRSGQGIRSPGLYRAGAAAGGGAGGDHNALSGRNSSEAHPPANFGSAGFLTPEGYAVLNSIPSTIEGSLNALRSQLAAFPIAAGSSLPSITTVAGEVVVASWPVAASGAASVDVSLVVHATANYAAPETPAMLRAYAWVWGWPGLDPGVDWSSFAGGATLIASLQHLGAAGPGGLDMNAVPLLFGAPLEHPSSGGVIPGPPNWMLVLTADPGLPAGKEPDPPTITVSAAGFVVRGSV